MLNLLFPAECSGCGSVLNTKKELLCVSCRHSLPLACHHLTLDETLKNLWYGRLPLVQATALLRFEKQGITQRVLHQLKYRGQKELSTFFGHWLGAELQEIDTYATIDTVIPVPLHKKRLRKRGYNQVTGFGNAIATALDVPFLEDVLLKVTAARSQVFKGRLSRFGGTEVFTLNHREKVMGKHILLVDDVVTTGATLERCGLCLLEGTEAKLSIATIAVA
ncbi:ComF family protein [Altibacter sp. HG106]|uniref:ComF family protein n=1 Tax=Altibacter sp. HG106 TaxID=3023937 RepID=UPI002350F01B|nr:phosphoribosyltransferase family protein [Altibacter sp. HG106]MDC7995171.1 phosphoribosyltransferase family protein [Altibacter sp. HG106]